MDVIYMDIITIMYDHVHTSLLIIVINIHENLLDNIAEQS